MSGDPRGRATDRLAVDRIGLRVVALGSAALLLVAASACRHDAAATAERAYAPLYPSSETRGAEHTTGTIKGDFDRCVESRSLASAAPNWEAFLETWDPSDGEYEDGFHALHVRAAKLELARAYYLLGRADDGDRLMLEIEPLGIQ